jgi:enoyl-[acyl-carrier protein] reductase II
MENRITSLFKIKYPIIQGGMVWCSGWQLASAVSNTGGLGLLGAGSMHPELLTEHIEKTRAATSNPFGVNVPLMYPQIDLIMEIIIDKKVPVVFTSAGNPALWTKHLKEHGIVVVHVISNTKFALKSQQAGVDAIVAEGFEAGGHNGREETTTMCLVPHIRKQVSLPLIAAGGIGSGQSIAAALALGAEGVQIGSRFAACVESSAHPDFKKAIWQATDGDTKLMLKKLSPTRLLHNHFYDQVAMLEDRGGNADEFKLLLGSGRAKNGMFMGNLTEGELEIGQVSAMIDGPETVSEIMAELVEEYNKTVQQISGFYM